MPYRRNNFELTVDSSFRPFSLQEMMIPLTMYKDAYEKTEEAYENLTSNADKFKYLSETLPEGSRARQIYEGYANELNTQAEDLARNGLSVNNRRALTGLKRRYQGEIGRLDRAMTTMDEERKRRQAMNAKDNSLLYATDNLNIDDFLDDNTPNLYSVSGNDLQALGANLGKAISSREYSAGDEGSILGGYYRDWVDRVGVSQDSVAAFMQRPEVLQEVDNILEAQGVNGNLSGNNLARARQNVMNGIYSGIVYQESHKPVKDESKISAAQAASHALQREKLNMERQDWQDRRNLMYEFDDAGNVIGFNSEYIGNNYEMDPNTGKMKRKSTAKTDEEKAEIAAQKAEASDAKARGTALMKLGNSDLKSNKGFEVTYGDKRKHYTYIGAISSHDGEWRQGAIGDDVPGRGWGFTSSSNVMSKWGNFSGKEGKERRVLSEDEIYKLLGSDPEFFEALKERFKESGIDMDTMENDFQIIEVPNESDSNKKGYIIAIED